MSDIQYVIFSLSGGLPHTHVAVVYEITAIHLKKFERENLRD